MGQRTRGREDVREKMWKEMQRDVEKESTTIWWFSWRERTELRRIKSKKDRKNLRSDSTLYAKINQGRLKNHATRICPVQLILLNFTFSILTKHSIHNNTQLTITLLVQ